MMILVALIAGYIGLLVVLAMLAKPYRARIAILANALVAEYPQSDKMRMLCEFYTETAYGWRSAPIKFVAFVLGLLMPGDMLDEMCAKDHDENPELLDDERLHELIDCYDASIAAVNPIFGVLMFAALWAFRVKATIHHRGKLRNRKLADYVGMRAATT